MRAAMGVYVLGGKGKGTTMLDVLHSRPPKNAMFMFQHGNKSPDARDDSRKHTGNTGAGSTSKTPSPGLLLPLGQFVSPSSHSHSRSQSPGHRGNGEYEHVFSLPFLFCRGLNSRHQIPVSRVY